MFILLSPKYVQNAVIDWCAGRLFLAIQSCLPQTSLSYLSLMPKSKNYSSPITVTSHSVPEYKL